MTSVVSKTLDVFAFRDAFVANYKNFATSFTTVPADDIREPLQAICETDRYCPAPLNQINPSYGCTTTVILGVWWKG